MVASRKTTDNRHQIILNLAFFILAELASLYTHYYDTFILAAVNVFVFAFALLEHRWQTLARWVGAQVVLVLVYAPWVLFGTNRVTTYNEASAEKSVSLLDIFSRSLAGFVVSDSVPDIFGTVVWLPLSVALVAILVYLVRKNREGAAFLFLYIAVPTLAVYVISIGRPLFLERYLNGIAPAYYLVFAVGLAAMQKAKVTSQKFAFRFLPFAFCLLLFASTSAYALTNYYFDPAYAKAPNWRALMQFVVARQQPGDIVVQNFTDDAISYYRNLLMHQGAPAEQQPGCDNPLGYLPVITLPRDYFPAAVDERRVKQLNTDCRRIWFIPSTNEVWDPDQFIGRLLARTDDGVINTLIAGYRLQLYLTPREFEPKIIPVNARIGDAALVGYRTEGARALHVVLYWRAARPIEKDYTVFVHLASAGDYVIAQKDNAPVGGTYPTNAWQPDGLIVDAYDLQVDAAPGTYALLVGMYDPATLARVPALDANGVRLTNDRVLLRQVTIPQ